ncbi:MAG: hypothetical protein U5L95_04735 [Candidatus Saccharibacteria bacterium]|nr:hypothetical protein [Candidatus Saccharibacteria bacterium]
MASTKKRSNFFDSEEGIAAREKLKALVKNKDFNTRSGFSANEEKYPDGVIPFVDEHMEYLRTHPQISVEHYISNLRLRTRAR